MKLGHCSECVSRHRQPSSFIISASNSGAHRWGLGAAATKLHSLPKAPSETFCSEARNPSPPGKHPFPDQSLPWQTTAYLVGSRGAGRKGRYWLPFLTPYRQSQLCPNWTAFSFCHSILDRTVRNCYGKCTNSNKPGNENNTQWKFFTLTCNSLHLLQKGWQTEYTEQAKALQIQIIQRLNLELKKNQPYFKWKFMWSALEQKICG